MLTLKKTQNSFKKWKINHEKIKEIVKVAYIVAICLVIGQFHISIPNHTGWEIEKLDLSMLVTFLCIGIVKLRIIIFSVILVPVIDNLLMHGHGIIWTPFEIASNILITIIVYIALKNAKKNVFDIIKKIFLIILMVGLRYIFHIVFISIALDIKIITILNGDDSIAFTIWILVLINFVKFSIIIFLTGIIKIRRNYNEHPNY